MASDNISPFQDGNEKEYFAALEDPHAVASRIWGRKRTYERYVRDTGLFSLWRKMHWAFHGREDGTNFRTTEIGADGPEGELHVFKVNHLRSIMTAWDSLLGAQRTAVSPVAMDDDYESEMQVKRSKAALDHYIGQGSSAQLELTEIEVRESAGLYGSGFGVQLWNPLLGPLAVPMMMGGGQNINAGDLQSWALTPLDVAFDPWRKDSRIPWYLCRLWYSKHALIGRWPEYEKEILGLSPEPESEFLDFTLVSEGSMPPGRYSPDEVPLYYFCHQPTEAPGMEQGKMGFMLSGDVMLEWGPLMYQGRDGTPRMPVERLAPADIKRTPHGYTPAFDLLAPQQAADTLSTIELTNARTYGLGSMATPKGGDIEPVQVSEGLQLVEYQQGMDKPSFLETPETSERIPMQRKDVIGEMGLILGVNGVVRGDAAATVDKSGSAMALLDAKAVQANNPFLSRCVRWKEGFYLTTVCILQTHLTEPRQFAMMGQSIATLTEAFSGQGIGRILKVRIETVNPLSQTTSGKLQIADTIAERFAGDITPGDYFRLLEEGNANFLTHHQDQKERCIDRENELLAQGIGPIPQVPVMGPNMRPMMRPNGQPMMQPAPQPGARYVVALMTDDHRHHVRLHATVLDNPAVREQQTPQAQAVVKAVMGHIKEHTQLLAQATVSDPAILEMTGQMPLQAALPPPPPPGGPAPGGPPQLPGGHQQKALPPGHVPDQPGAGHHAGGSPEAKVEQPEPAAGGQQPRMPSMPKNPVTGRQAPGPAPQPPSPG